MVEMSMATKNPAAVQLGKRGGRARARNLTPEQRSEAARKAVEARWAKLRELTGQISRDSKKLLKKVERNTARAARNAKKARS